MAVDRVDVRRWSRATAALVVVALALVSPPAASAQTAQTRFPEVIALPAGWQPEGIAGGPGTTMFSGSLATTVTVIDLDPRTFASGTVVGELTSPNFDVPTTIAGLGNRLYLVNARFSTPPTPTTPYTMVAIPRR